jgi:hypothetical protein
MYILLRDKYFFNISEYTSDEKWLYLKGGCKELLNREVTICLERTQSNLRRIKKN